MTLTIKERLLLGSILPEKGDITTLRLVRQLREAVSFSEEEHARLKIKNENGMVQWDPGAPQESEVPIGPKAHAIVSDTLTEMSKAKALTDDFVSLWDKFNPEG